MPSVLYTASTFSHIVSFHLPYLRRFRELGARFVRMTGSGSTVFAAFETPGQAAHAAAQVEGAIATCSLGEGQS